MAVSYSTSSTGNKILEMLVESTFVILVIFASKIINKYIVGKKCLKPSKTGFYQGAWYIGMRWFDTLS